MSESRRCIVCFRHEHNCKFLCAACCRSLDLNCENDRALSAFIRWAANRARYFERRRRGGK